MKSKSLLMVCVCSFVLSTKQKQLRTANIFSRRCSSRSKYIKTYFLARVWGTHPAHLRTIQWNVYSFKLGLALPMVVVVLQPPLDSLCKFRLPKSSCLVHDVRLCQQARQLKLASTPHTGTHWFAEEHSQVQHLLFLGCSLTCSVPASTQRSVCWGCPASTLCVGVESPSSAAPARS